MERKLKMIKGFYPFLDNIQLEFLTPVDTTLSCELCNTVTKSYYVAKCGHFLCQGCHSLIQKEKPPKCPLDDIDWELKTSCGLPEHGLPLSRVRCPNTGYGCKYEGYLSEMNDHVNPSKHYDSCQFYPLPCVKCGDTVGYNNLVSHLRRSCGFRGTKTADPKPAVLDAVE
ncbi:hypothetical protein HPB47_017019 [Ixodes persulcatus]|uniref:Uncharacterized protein n=1 Tax=Ixodes persulcatus TaxID=34615 RepID=A0AC60QSZ1_IXOPE|nr:hypothetical protein HPB47_017019 [Ixodes persulcatus]